MEPALYVNGDIAETERRQPHFRPRAEKLNRDLPLSRYTRRIDIALLNVTGVHLPAEVDGAVPADSGRERRP